MVTGETVPGEFLCRRKELSDDFCWSSRTGAREGFGRGRTAEGASIAIFPREE